MSSRLERHKFYDPDREYKFRYESKYHRKLPHVVKFSGGKSSGMLLFTLLENGILRQDRGDVVIFNNTSCEHPQTYKFVAECKRRVESDYGIPFFYAQFQTYEDATQGEWRRLPSYRLVNEFPFADDNPDGFRWKGEVFEEMLSYKAYLPNQFRRVCTASLKLEVTRLFLRDWFASKSSVPSQGHGLDKSLVDHALMYRRHIRDGGGVPKEILIRKKEYVLSQQTVRPKQRYLDFSLPAREFTNDAISDRIFGGKARFGAGGIEYVAFIGLRGDEQMRTARVEARKSDPHANSGYEGEHVYMPLAKMHITRDDVNGFWEQQEWGLNLPEGGSLSNCVYCFLKGGANLSRVHEAMEKTKTQPVEGFGSMVGTPCDIDWWSSIEKRYGRDLKEEKRDRTNQDGHDFIGFFGASGKFSFDILANASKNGEDLSHIHNVLLPCDCTE